MFNERFENLKKNNNYEFKELLEEHESASYYPLLKKIPNELVQKHLEIVAQQMLNEDETLNYFQELINKRKEATTESYISDKMLDTISKQPNTEIFEHLDTDVFNSPDIGSGQTARIKKFEFKKNDLRIPIAVKYLVSPTPMTLSASAEHDMLHEMERIQTIEEMERNMSFKYVGVPHPYFHHQTEHIQCYGMELIDGANLQEILDNAISYEQSEQFKKIIAEIPLDTIISELSMFLKKMHSYCLHGDIKPRNFMLDTKGKIYLIDFGQSVL